MAQNAFLAGDQYTPDPSQTYSDPAVIADPATADATQPPKKKSTLDQVLELMKSKGITPGGKGSGFADSDYWSTQADKSVSGGWDDYWNNRLGSDLEGTGTDQPSGLEGPGAWMNSGSQSRGGGGGGPLGLRTSGWSADPRSDALFNKLLDRSNQSLDVNPNDPVIRGQTNAFEAAQTRAERNYEQGLAESEGPIANIGAEKRMGAEKIGQNTAAFQASLMSRELQSRRDEIQSALTQMGGQLSDQQRMQLQQELALMDNALGQAGLQQGAYQFDVNDEFRRSPLA